MTGNRARTSPKPDDPIGWTTVPGSACSRRLRCGAAAMIALAALAALAAAAPVPPAAAATAGGTGQFGITPAPRDGVSPPYFTMTLAAGQSATGTAIITNAARTATKLKLSRTTGVTAGNGGSAFSQPFQRCAGPGCWVTGLPRTVTLPGRTQERLTFRVRVPPRTPPGQYLAGLSAELAAKPRAVQVGSNGKGALARAIIVREVTVGVAVTVGSPSQLTTRLRIPAVSGVAIDRLARLNILLRNTGQTFTHARGHASCTAAGRRHTYLVYAGTVLPHGQAEIPANAPGLPEGTAMPCTVRLRYGPGLTASWTGSVTIPAPPAGRIVHTGPGAYSVIPPNTIPAWAIALIVIGALALLAMAASLLRTRRRSRFP
jgi:hypothetical protein